MAGLDSTRANVTSTTNVTINLCDTILMVFCEGICTARQGKQCKRFFKGFTNKHTRTVRLNIYHLAY